jgi:LuxR family transcriptional regulator, maltose regulon positive regulatory protein
MKEFFHILRTWMALLRQDPEQAEIHGELAVHCGKAAGHEAGLAAAWLGRALAHCARSEHQEARTCLEEAFAITGRVEIRQIEFGCLLAQAESLLETGEEPAALASLRAGMALGKEKKYFHTYYWRPKAMARLCAKALEAAIEPEYVRELIRKRELPPDEGAVHLETWPWPIRIRTLGAFELLRDDVPVVFVRKTQKRPLALLGAFVAFGAKGASGDGLCDALWPEAEGDKAQHAFEMALHRLRKLLGDPTALLLQAGRLTLDPTRCWVDAWAVERLLSQAREAWQHGPHEEAVANTERALALDRGSLLAEAGEAPWAIPSRERLRGMVLQATERAGAHWEGVENWATAAACYERILAVEPAAEALSCRLMICCAKLGRQAELASILERCRSALWTRSGLSPSPATMTLFERLTGRAAPPRDRSLA